MSKHRRGNENNPRHTTKYVEETPSVAVDTGDYRLEAEWYDLQEVCALKGINPKTAKNGRWRLPNGGFYDGVVCGKKRWRRTTVLEWLPLTDDELRRRYKCDQ